MSGVLAPFTSAILPIIAIAAVGYLIARQTGLEVDPLNTVAINFFLPALVFHGIATTDLSGETVIRLVVGVLAYIFILMGIAYVGGRALGVSDALLPAVALSSTFTNSGFVGIPLLGFVFGDLGRTTATLYITTQGVVLYTLGVYAVSSGGESAALEAVREVFRLPLVYAVAAAAALRGLRLVPPTDGTFMTTVDTVGSASIPLMLTVVGIQLAEVKLGALRRTVFPAGLKLVVAPVVGAALALAVGFSDPRISNIFVIECATPTAVTSLALIIAYDETSEEGFSAAEFTSTVIFVTTVLSVIVLTVLVVAVQSGWLF